MEDGELDDGKGLREEKNGQRSPGIKKAAGAAIRLIGI